MKWLDVKFAGPKTMHWGAEVAAFAAVTVLASLASSLMLGALVGDQVSADVRQIDGLGVSVLIGAFLLVQLFGIARIIRADTNPAHVARMYRMIEALVVAPLTVLLGAGAIWVTQDWPAWSVTGATILLAVASGGVLLWYIRQSRGPRVSPKFKR